MMILVGRKGRKEIKMSQQVRQVDETFHSGPNDTAMIARKTEAQNTTKNVLAYIINIINVICVAQICGYLL